MEENYTIKRQILPEDITSVSDNPTVNFKTIINKKSLLIFGILVFAAVAGLYATNTDLFKGNLQLDTIKETNLTKEVKLYSLFKKIYINDSKVQPENNIVFIVKGNFPAATTDVMTTETSTTAPITTQITTELDNAVTTNDKQAIEQPNTFTSATAIGDNLVVGEGETNESDLDTNKMVSGDSFFNTQALQGNMFTATEDPIRSIFVANYSYTLLIGKADQKGALTINLNDDILAGSGEYKIFSVNVDQYTNNLTAGTWQATLVATEKLTGDKLTTSPINFEIVTTEAAYDRPVNLEASYSGVEGLQYRMVLNPVLVEQTTFKQFMDSNLESATVKLTPVGGGTALSFPLTNADLKLLENSTNFPTSQDNKIGLAELKAKAATGEYNVSVDLKFNFAESDNLPNVNSMLTTSTNAVRINVPAELPAPDPIDLTCNDRLSAGAIAISPASHNFGEVERSKNSEIDIVVTKATGQTFTDLRIVINDDATPITARIGDKALGESMTSANSMFAIATALTINVDFDPTRANSYTNRISIYDPRVPATCDPVAVIELQGKGINAPQETSNDPDEGIAYINDQRQQYELNFNPGAAELEYYANSYNYVPEALPVVTEPSHSGYNGTGADTEITSADPMPIAETGPGLLLYPALMAVSAVAARRFRK